MSVTRFVILRCDAESDECHLEPGGVTPAIGELPRTVAEARQNARRHNWKHINGSDYCPPCYSLLKEKS